MFKDLETIKGICADQAKLAQCSDFCERRYAEATGTAKMPARVTLGMDMVNRFLTQVLGVIAGSRGYNPFTQMRQTCQSIIENGIYEYEGPTILGICDFWAEDIDFVRTRALAEWLLGELGEGQGTDTEVPNADGTPTINISPGEGDNLYMYLRDALLQQGMAVIEKGNPVKVIGSYNDVEIVLEAQGDQSLTDIEATYNAARPGLPPDTTCSSIQEFMKEDI